MFLYDHRWTLKHLKTNSSCWLYEMEKKKQLMVFNVDYQQLIILDQYKDGQQPSLCSSLLT